MSTSDKGQGRAAFDDWVVTLRAAVSRPARAPALAEVADEARKRFGICLRFARITGPRWAYLTGTREGAPSGLALDRIQLTGGLGLISDARAALTAGQYETLLQALRELARHGGDEGTVGEVKA